MATSFAASAAERTALLKDPHAFAARAEHVLSGLLQKLRSVEAVHTAERIETERAQHRLEQQCAGLREGQQRLATQHATAVAERGAAVEARGSAVAEVERCAGELR